MERLRVVSCCDALLLLQQVDHVIPPFAALREQTAVGRLSYIYYQQSLYQVLLDPYW